MKKPTRGGKRPFSGRKPQYGESTTTVAFRVPVSKVDEIKRLVKIRLSKFQTSP